METLMFRALLFVSLILPTLCGATMKDPVVAAVSANAGGRWTALGNVEAKFHSALNAWSVGGEWFELCESSMRVLCILIERAGPAASVEDWPGGRFVNLVLEYSGQSYGEPAYKTAGGRNSALFPDQSQGDDE